MSSFLITMAVLAGFVSLITLSVWGGSGSFRAAWDATKQYLLVMGLLVGAGMVLSILILLARVL